MMRKSRKENGGQPATQADLALWGGQLSQRIDGVESVLQKILSIIQTMDADRREQRAQKIAFRIEQLEKESVYLHKEVIKLKQGTA